MDWTIAALVGLAGFTLTVGGIVWRLAQTLAILVADVGRLTSDVRRLTGDIDKLDGSLTKSADELRRESSAQIKELQKLVMDSSVTKDHLLLQLQTLELRVLNGLLERVIKLIKSDTGG